jgi:hypothetical protein
MKGKKKFSNKLSINKSTIANLDYDRMKNILGGKLCETASEYSIDPVTTCPNLTEPCADSNSDCMYSNFMIC